MSDPDGWRAWQRALLLAVAGLAFLLRAPAITEWWLNPDEGIYFSVVTHDTMAAFWAEALSTAHPPLYFLILRGVGAMTHDFVWLRAVALACGAAAPAVFVLLTREIVRSGTREIVRPRARAWAAGLLAGVAIAFSPRAIILSQVIRPYMLLLLLLAGALFFLLRYLGSPSRRALAGYALCSTVAVTLHYSAVLALGVLGLLVLCDGKRRGLARQAWRRLAVTQAGPLAAIAVLYLTHVRTFLTTAEASGTIDCCLGAYMAHTPLDAWHGFVGFHSLLAGESLAVPAAVLTLLAVAYAGWRRAWMPFAMTVSSCLVALAASYLQIYPFGPTRHSMWLFVFVVPTLAWAVTGAVSSGARGRVSALVVLAALLAGSGPLRRALDSPARPRDISERVLRSGYLEAMAEPLDPTTGPELVIMSTETYRILIPLFTTERQSAITFGDGSYRAFSWGTRTVVVLPGRDFTSSAGDVDQPDHLLAALRAAAEALDSSLGDDARILVLAAGYESHGMAEMVSLAQRTGDLGTTLSVPGMIALELDVRAYADAMGVPRI